jgi:enamine deaminase RidA (YjgF/YER057c/UK114 family)
MAQTTDRLRTYTIESPQATEVFISAVPRPDQPIEDEAKRIFQAIHDRLSGIQGVGIFQERLFGTEAVLIGLRGVRAQCYGPLDDGVAPSELVCPQSRGGPWAGVQVHAIASDTRAQVIRGSGGKACGRLVQAGGCRYLGLSAISDPLAGDESHQARAMFDQAHGILQSHGASFLKVPRTWLWLGDITAWYDRFNRARNAFFTDCGILGAAVRPPMPASTGIGLRPAGGAACAMDLTAVLEPAQAIEYFQAGGKQRSAFEYGSAFSRASRAVTPAGQTVFVSGTASIDQNGHTVHVGDAARQIERTIENVLALLSDMQCRPDDVVQALVYCKTVEAEALFEAVKGTLDWPWITMITDVCRPDLLFEIEVTAVPRR